MAPELEVVEVASVDEAATETRGDEVEQDDGEGDLADAIIVCFLFKREQ